MGVSLGLALILLVRVRWFWQLWGLGALYHGVAGASVSLSAAPSQDFTSSSDRV